MSLLSFLGEKAILVIKPEFGYGARGAGGTIPGGATLLFEVRIRQCGLGCLVQTYSSCESLSYPSLQVELMSISGKAEL